jgi:hypothetical protein
MLGPQLLHHGERRRTVGHRLHASQEAAFPDHQLAVDGTRRGSGPWGEPSAGAHAFAAQRLPPPSDTDLAGAVLHCPGNEWEQRMFDMEAPWWEFILRAGVVYVALLVMVRVSGKRTVGQFTPFDLVVVMLLSEAVSGSINGQDGSLPGGLIAGATLVAAGRADRRCRHAQPAHRCARGGQSRC